MIVDETLGNIERCRRHLEATQPDSAGQAIVAAPQWFLDQVKAAFAEKLQAPDDEIEELHGFKVVKRDDIDEPLVITADGKLYRMLPGWARAANRGKAT